MTELLQSSTSAEMYLEGVVITPRVARMYDDVLENNVDGAAYDIRNMLAVNGLAKGIKIDAVFYNELIETHKNPELSLKTWLEEKPESRHVSKQAFFVESYIKFMLAQANGNLPKTLENLRAAEIAVQTGKDLIVIDGSVDRAIAEMNEVNDPRGKVAMSLMSLGLGDDIDLLYGKHGNSFSSYYSDEVAERTQDILPDDGSIPVTPFVPLLFRSEQLKKLLPVSVQHQFINDDDICGHAILHEDVLYTIRYSFFAEDESDNEYRIYDVMAQVMTPEGVDGIHLMAIESR